MSFDRLADGVGEQVARSWFFAVCCAFILAWATLLPVQGWNNNVWHLWLNSPTTSVTFLLVALLHNNQHRFEQATNERLQALLEAAGVSDPVADPGQQPKEER